MFVCILVYNTSACHVLIVLDYYSNFIRTPQVSPVLYVVCIRAIVNNYYYDSKLFSSLVVCEGLWFHLSISRSIDLYAEGACPLMHVYPHDMHTRRILDLPNKTYRESYGISLDLAMYVRYNDI